MTQRCIHRKHIFDAYKGENIDQKCAWRCLFLCKLMVLQCCGRSWGRLGNPQECWRSRQSSKTHYALGDSLKVSTGGDSAASPLEKQATEAHLQYGRSSCKSNICQIEMLGSYLLKGSHDQLLWDDIHLLWWRFSQFCTISKMLLRSKRAP